MDTLDLRKNGRLSIAEANLISELEPQIRDECNEYIGRLAKQNNIKNIGWLLQTLNRNTYITQIFDSFYKLGLLQELVNRGVLFKSVIVDDEELYVAVKQIISNDNCKITFLNKKPSSFKRLLLNIFKNLYYLTNFWFFSKLVSNNKKPTGRITYIDTYLSVNSFNPNGEYFERFYPGMMDEISEEERNAIWLAPTLDGAKYPQDFYKLFRLIRNSNIQFIIKEDWLKLSDYLKAIYLSITLPLRIKKIPLWNGIDVSNVIRGQLNMEIGSFSISNPVLRYLSISRLKDAGINIRLVVDWFENQTVDSALNLGFHKFYPGVKIKGYQGYVVPDIFACQQPTSYEVEAGTIPDEIAVIGDIYLQHRKRYCPELKVTTAPAFRFRNTINFKNTGNVKKNKIVLALPVRIDDCRDIVNICLGVRCDNQFKFIVKQHPSYSRVKFMEMIPELEDDRFSFSDKSLTELFHEAVLLVSNSSSVCIEAVLCGLFVAIVGSRSGPAMNPLLGYVSDDYWSLCYTSECIEKLLSRSPTDRMLNIKSYLIPVTKTSVNDFLEL